MGLQTFTLAAKLITILGLAGLVVPSLRAQGNHNPGDPLFCDPNEGITFLIVNGGAGVFTANSDCFGGNLTTNNTNPAVIATSQGGTLTRNGNSSSGNYIYTPPTPSFTGLDSFPFTVTTVCNRVGGPGSISPTCPGSTPFTFTITLNVLPATITVNTSGAPVLIPIPAGSVTGCPASVTGQSGTGPTASEILGCTTTVIRGFTAGGVNPTFGTAVNSGHTVLYTPGVNFTTSDTFTVQVQGVNSDGTTSLNSGFVTVNIVGPTRTAPAPTLGAWGMALLGTALLLFGIKAASQRTA